MMHNLSIGRGLQLLGLVEAGFPSHAYGEILDTMSLDEYLVEREEATYTMRVKTDALREEGILEGDLLLVERGREPEARDIVVVEEDGEMLLKLFGRESRETKVVAVVTSVIRKLR